MYFIEDGSVKVMMKKIDESAPVQVNALKKGDYFGELALLTKQPRVASVIAAEKTKLAVLDVESFERLLGPCLGIMQRNIHAYEEQLTGVFGSLANVPELTRH